MNKDKLTYKLLAKPYEYFTDESIEEVDDFEIAHLKNVSQMLGGMVLVE